MALSDKEISALYFEALGSQHLREQDRKMVTRFAHAVESEVRKSDEALIQQLVEALENSHATLWEEEDDPSRPAHAAITAGRARLEGMTDKPTPTTDLLKRCAEIHEWRSTGVLSGEALRDYAKQKWPDRHDTLQMAEHETVTEALALLAKWGQPAQAQADSVQEDAARESEYRRGYRHGYEQRDAEVRGAMA